MCNAVARHQCVSPCCFFAVYPRPVYSGVCSLISSCANFNPPLPLRQMPKQILSLLAVILLITICLIILLIALPGRACLLCRQMFVPKLADKKTALLFKQQLWWSRTGRINSRQIRLKAHLCFALTGGRRRPSPTTAPLSCKLLCNLQGR